MRGGRTQGKARPPRVRPRRERTSHKGQPKEARAEVATHRRAEGPQGGMGEGGEPARGQQREVGDTEGGHRKPADREAPKLFDIVIENLD